MISEIAFFEDYQWVVDADENTQAAVINLGITDDNVNYTGPVTSPIEYGLANSDRGGDRVTLAFAKAFNIDLDGALETYLDENPEIQAVAGLPATASVNNGAIIDFRNSANQAIFTFLDTELRAPVSRDDQGTDETPAELRSTAYYYLGYDHILDDWAPDLTSHFAAQTPEETAKAYFNAAIGNEIPEEIDPDHALEGTTKPVKDHYHSYLNPANAEAYLDGVEEPLAAYQRDFFAEIGALGGSEFVAAQFDDDMQRYIEGLLNGNGDPNDFVRHSQAIASLQLRQALLMKAW